MYHLQPANQLIFSEIDQSYYLPVAIQLLLHFMSCQYHYHAATPATTELIVPFSDF